MQDIRYKYKIVVNGNTGSCTGVCLLEWGWGQECQRLPNFGSGLQLISLRRLQDLQKTQARVPETARRFRRRVLLTLHDMQ
jgi:hypothetical protein